MSDGPERIFQDKVIQIAVMNGWSYHHIVPRQVQGRWLSDTPGFPDLVLAHPSRGFILAELKSPTGQLTPAQRSWLEITDGQTVESRLWRPNDLERIALRLGRKS